MSLPGKPEWHALLSYVAELHERSVHYPPAFGHWDIVHQAIDQAQTNPEHAANQLRNLLAAQQADGFLPGAIYFREGKPAWGAWTHPPLWPLAVEILGNTELQAELAPALVKQIGWFERNRRADDGIGFYYADLLGGQWESGVAEGVRYEDAPVAKLACVDATAHLYACYAAAARWTGEARYQGEADRLNRFIETHLFNPTTGWFHDAWDSTALSFEGMWPLVVGAGTADQRWAVRTALLDPERFFGAHPVRTVALKEPLRGPAWNSMTFWAACGLIELGHPEAARPLLEAALENTAHWFGITGTIWEFYDSEGGDPREVARKPQTPFNRPSPDYLGHNPLNAMAQLWEECQE